MLRPCRHPAPDAGAMDGGTMRTLKVQVPVDRFTRQEAVELLDQLVEKVDAHTPVNRSSIEMRPPEWIPLVRKKWVLTAEWADGEQR